MKDKPEPETRLSDNHWTIEIFKERMTTKQWKKILLTGRDNIIVGGCCRQLKAKNLGCGVVEISKIPLRRTSP